MIEAPFSYRPLGSFRSYDPLDGLVFCKGDGNTLWDTNGKSYLDFISGYSACNLGHAHPKLTEVAVSQLKELTFCTSANTLVRTELERSLADLWSASKRTSSTESVAKVWLCSSGARAVEVAWKLAYANRPGMLMRFDLGYHGRSLATSYISDTRESDALRRQLDADLSGQDRKSIDDKSAAGVIPFPRCGTQCQESCELCEASLAAARHWLELHADETSAMIVEPVIGSRGYYFAGRSFHRRLANLVREFKVQVISDEIQMGLGRLGKMLVSHEDGWDADFTVLGKSLGGGIVAIAAVLGEASKMDSLHEGIESETFAANALACRVAIESLRLLNDASLKRNVHVLGENFRALLRDILPAFLKIDGLGLATAIDLCNTPKQFGTSMEMAFRWVGSMKESGLLTHLTGAHRDRIALIPPLIIDDVTVRRAANIMKQFWKNS